jgi:hypothetical protein
VDPAPRADGEATHQRGGPDQPRQSGHAAPHAHCVRFPFSLRSSAVAERRRPRGRRRPSLYQLMGSPGRCPRRCRR